jgi:hypothetical protein
MIATNSAWLSHKDAKQQITKNPDHIPEGQVTAYHLQLSISSPSTVSKMEACWVITERGS